MDRSAQMKRMRGDQDRGHAINSMGFGHRSDSAENRFDEYTWLTMRTLRAILTDSHLWVPLLVLVAGIALLMRLI